MSVTLKSTTILSDLWNCKSIILYGKYSNEWYARDISRKVAKAYRTRHENGAHYGAYAPLGYVKDPDKKGHL